MVGQGGWAGGGGAYWPATSRGLTSLLLAAHDDRAVGVVHHEVRHAAHDGAAHLAQTSRTHHDHCGLLLVSHLHDDLARLGAALGTNVTGHL